MRFFDRFFRKPKSILPCHKIKECPYEYDKNPARDIEGMPYAEGDPRSCPDYGHICPEFMEEFGLTVEDLQIRSVIHCGRVMEHLIEDGKYDKSSELCIALMKKYEEFTSKYPAEQYPHYY